MRKLISITALGLLAAALVSSVALAGRVGVDSKAESKAAAASAATPSQANPQGQGSVVAKPGSQTIAQVAAGNPAFSTLVSLLQLTGLDTVVNSNDVTLTVFAPTNAAFTKLFTANPSLPGILTSPAQAALGYPLLKNVLLYHVTDGRRFSNSVFNQNNAKTIEMLNGGSITAKPNLTLTDGAGQTINPILTPSLINISASNGVIHVIDTVLLPAS